MRFREAVEACQALRAHYRTGLTALEGYSARVTIRDTRLIAGSVNIERAQREANGQSHTWDYGIGITARSDDLLVWLEIHSANSLHVQDVIDKLDSLLAFVQEHAPELSRMRSQFVWLATGSVYIPPGSRERRRLNARGVLLRSKQLHLQSLL